MRLFLAISLPDELRRSAFMAAEPLRAAVPDAAWGDASRLHLTLKFLGQTTEEQVPKITDALRRLASRHAPFPMRLGGVGAFPSLRDPRVVWLGVAPSASLDALQRDVEAESAALGYERENRPFRPHITLGRTKGRTGAALAPVAPGVQYQATVRVETIELMESRLSGSGPRYAALASVPLRTD